MLDHRPAQALDCLRQGNQRYVSGLTRQWRFSPMLEERQIVQRPIAVIISCSDSRVVPEFVFDQPPGSLFVVRVAGNIINDYGLATVEFALEQLNVPLVLVLGHTDCRAIQVSAEAVAAKLAPSGYLGRLTEVLSPIVKGAQDQLQPSQNLLTQATIENIKHTMVRLNSAADIIKPLVFQKKLEIVGAIYSVQTGKVTLV